MRAVRAGLSGLWRVVLAIGQDKIVKTRGMNGERWLRQTDEKVNGAVGPILMAQRDVRLEYHLLMKAWEHP